MERLSEARVRRGERNSPEARRADSDRPHGMSPAAGHIPVSALREEFPGLAHVAYFDSHALGAMPRAAVAALQEFAALWIAKGSTAWYEWFGALHAAAARVEQLLRAPSDSVLVAACNVSHVQAVIASCMDYTAERRRVVYTALDFPSVSYVWKSEERRGAEVVIVPSDDGISVSTERVLAAIDERTAVVPISHVFFRSSCIQDLAPIVARAHEVGALVLVDAYQSAGTVPIDVTALGADMVCGGFMKWLCGGPGLAYLYVRPEVIPRLRPRATGWFGHHSPVVFAMPDQEYAEGIWRLAGGTPAIGVLYQVRAGLDIVNSLGVEAIRENSCRQTESIVARCLARGDDIRCPLDAEWRGGTVVLNFPDIERITQELQRRRFACSYTPGIGLRVSPHFYTTDNEIDQLMDELDRLRR
jgi:kynureninase